MKFRSIALILTLALSLVGWAQEAPAPSAAPNSTPATQPKSCCHHAAADAKDAASCCGKDKCEMKDGKSCCDAKNMKAAMKECKKNGCCDGKSCAKATGDKTAMNCCGNKCERHPQTPAGS
ncbi:MAG: hypothetical protein ABSB87_12150 [Terriglobales bacterium]|jgi:hypothetical protein